MENTLIDQCNDLKNRFESIRRDTDRIFHMMSSNCKKLDEMHEAEIDIIIEVIDFSDEKYSEEELELSLVI